MITEKSKIKDTKSMSFRLYNFEDESTEKRIVLTKWFVIHLEKRTELSKHIEVDYIS